MDPFKNTGFRLEFISMKIGTGMTETGRPLCLPKPVGRDADPTKGFWFTKRAVTFGAAGFSLRSRFGNHQLPQTKACDYKLCISQNPAGRDALLR